MTDARLEAAVEAAAVAVSGGWTFWRCRLPSNRELWRDDIRPIVRVILAAADAWDREQGIMRLPNVTPPGFVSPYVIDWSLPEGDREWVRNAAQEQQKPPQDSRTASGGTPGPTDDDEGSGGAA